MALFRTLNALGRETLNLARQTLGLGARKAHAAKGRPTLYRTFEQTALRRTATAPASVLQTTTLKVCELVRETADAVSVTLARPDGQPMVFKAGMFFTVLITIDGQEYRRAYSLSSAPQDASTATITVKRVAGGKVSNWINDHLALGSTLRVLGPSGNFVLTPDPAQARHLLLVGGGSGITPLMSIVRTALALEPLTQVHLLYGNRALDDVIFFAALRDLKKRHPKRLFLTHVLEHPPKAWRDKKGRLDRPMFARLLDAILDKTSVADLQVYTCGPAPMMQGAADELAARGLPPAQFHQETFTPAAGQTDMARFTSQTVHIHSDAKTWSGQAQAGQTLLEAGLACGAPMQFSCTLGGCGHCRVKLLEGEVDMPEPNCLLPAEKAQRYALSCIARPCSAVTFEIDPPQAH